MLTFFLAILYLIIGSVTSLVFQVYHKVIEKDATDEDGTVYFMMIFIWPLILTISVIVCVYAFVTKLSETVSNTIADVIKTGIKQISEKP